MTGVQTCALPIYALLQIFATGVLVSLDAIVGAFIILFFYALIAGRGFCSWVCPLNIVTDLASWLRGLLGLDKTQKKVFLSRSVRYWVLALALIVSFITGVAAFEMVSPIGMLQRGLIFGMGMGLAGVAIVFLFDLFVLKNGWCGYVCPLGAFYSQIGKYSLVRIMHNHEKCTSCMKCKEICPEVLVLAKIGKESGAIDKAECTNCGRCIEVCGDDALAFGLRSYINKKD